MPENVSLPGGSPAPLSRSLTSSGGFQQQGTIDWVDLAKSMFSSSIDIFSRFSAGNLDPYTSVVALAICDGFKLAPIGRKRIENSLLTLRSFGTLANALWIGVGIKSIVRSLAATEQGGICIALCAAMSECYHESIAAEIWVNIAASFDIPQDMKPSINQWKALLQACAGTFASTPFPAQAETLMQLHPRARRLGLYSYSSSMRRDARGCSSPSDLAKALLGVGKVSCGKLASITVVGGADAGWLAAIAEWLFDLRIHITGSSGELVYSNCQPGVHVQLVVMYDQPEGHSITQELELRTVGETHILANARKLIEKEIPGQYAAIVSGRVEWQSALYSTFGSDFKNLVDKDGGASHAFGLAVGNAAKIFKAIAQSDDSFRIIYRQQCRTYCDASFGQGFIENIIRWFPELTPLRIHMNKGIRIDLDQALSKYQANLSTIRTVCRCRLCLADEDDGYGDFDEDRFCCVVLTDTIIELARCLSAVTVPDTLLPTRGGLEIFYTRHLNLRRSKELASRYLEEMGPILFTMDLDPGYAWDQENEVAERRLQRALQIFTGRDVQQSVFGISALCENGICAYLDILRELSDHDEAIGRVNVVPGRIELHSKPYTSLEDSSVGADPLAPDISWNVDRLNMATKYKHVLVNVNEKSEALKISFDFSGQGHHEAFYKIGPAALAHSLTGSRGLVSCTRRNCQMLSVSSNVSADSILQSVSLDGRDIRILRGDKDTRCVQLGTIGDPETPSNYEAFVVDKECINCCLRTALVVNPDKRIVIFIAPGVRNLF